LDYLKTTYQIKRICGVERSEMMRPLQGMEEGSAVHFEEAIPVTGRGGL
jgi:hypothetical protein